MTMSLKQLVDSFTIADLRLAQQFARFVLIGPHSDGTRRGSASE
jgi:hypothetical protein